MIYLKTLHIENFKGCRSARYEFDGNNVTISGENGTGKTTIATSYYWLFSDRDYDLHSNPNIRPIVVEECAPRVEVVLDIDGREVTAAKIQKQNIKKSKAGGADTRTLSNSYEVNSVEYGERDFKAKMAEYGVDFDLFLALSHPDVFTSQKSNDMRKVLFSMSSEKSDKEIADMTDGANDAAEFLASYTMEEVKAMQNATIRKIKEVYGNKGEILRAKIEGLEMSKVDIDVAELELGKRALLEKITANKEKQVDVSRQFEEYQALSDGVLELRFQLSDFQRKENESLSKQRKNLQSQVDEKNDCIFDICNIIQKNNREIAGYEQDIESGTRERNRLAELWKSVYAEQFDENTAICPTCHRELPQDEREALLIDFEKSKAERLAKIEKDGLVVKSDVDNAKEMIPKLQECNKDNLANKEKLEMEVSELERQLSELPQSIDISDTDEYKSIRSQIAEKEQVMGKGNSAEIVRRNLEDENRELQSQLTEIEKQLALSQRNVEIDEQISDLLKKQSEYEQGKANAEKILYQLDLISRKRNELLTEDINSHFDLVEFKFFDYQKNGEYKEVCIPTYRNKDIGSATNTGLVILMKLDIIKGLQRFYGMYFPVFLDGAECLSEKSRNRIEMDCQMILLAVSDDKELKVEAE